MSGCWTDSKKNRRSSEGEELRRLRECWKYQHRRDWLSPGLSMGQIGRIPSEWIVRKLRFTIFIRSDLLHIFQIESLYCAG